MPNCAVCVPFATGLGLGFSLIVAIGAQNAFVLRQGLRGEYVFAVCLCCAVSDAFLIALGVGGFKAISARLAWFEPVLRYGGAAFLLCYAFFSLRSAMKSSSSLEDPQKDGGRSLGKTLLICLAFTWLNPHVYLDTVMLMGIFSTSFPGHELYFAIGAICASFIFFFALGYGAARLGPFLLKAKVWRIFEASIGCFMLFLGIKLILTSS